jgi:hypothetical protein
MRSRAKLAARAVRLRASGHSMMQIAERLGVSPSYASALYCDPDRSKEIARKNSYRKPCPECGALMDGSNGRRSPSLCFECSTAKQHEERYWTPERIIASIRRYAKENGYPPTSKEWLLNRPSWGAPVTAAQREFGSWANTIEAAGFKRPKIGLYGDRVDRSAEQVVAGIRDLANQLGRTPVYLDDTALAGSAVRYFGKWNRAVKAAGFKPRRSGGQVAA